MLLSFNTLKNPLRGNFFTPYKVYTVKLAHKIYYVPTICFRVINFCKMNWLGRLSKMEDDLLLKFNELSKLFQKQRYISCWKILNESITDSNTFFFLNWSSAFLSVAISIEQIIQVLLDILKKKKRLCFSLWIKWK